MATKHIPKMNFDCAVKLLRLDEKQILNTESVNSTISKNTGVCEKSSTIKRSTRISRKNSLPNNLIIDEDGQLDTKKETKSSCKKQKFSEVEPEKPPQKNKAKRKKMQISSSVKSTKTNSTNSDPTVLTHSCLNLNVSNEENISVPNSFEPSKSDTLTDNFVMANVNKDDVTDKLEIGNKIKLDKFPIKKSVKAISTKKKSSRLNDINKDNISNEHESSDKSMSLKDPKNKTSRSIINGKKKLDINNLNKNEISEKIESTINFVVSQAYLSEASKSTINISEIKNENLNKDNKSIVKRQKINNIVPPKTSPKSIPTIKKKPVINKKIASYTHEENNDLKITYQHECSRKKKVQSPETDINVLKNDIYLNRSKKLSVALENINYFISEPNTDMSEKSEDDNMKLKINSQLNQSKRLPIVLESKPNCPKTDLSEKSEDDTGMLKNNNKPPKLKNKWCDEWSGDRLSSQNMLKSNNISLDDSKQNGNNCNKLFKNVLKTQKSPNLKNVRAKRKKKLSTNIEDPDLIGSPDTDIDLKKSIKNTHETQSNENLSLINSITSTKPIDFENEIISETVGDKTMNDMPCVAETPSSSEVTVVPIVSTEISKSALSNDNDQNSRLSLNETISDHSYLSNPMVSSEISYGMAILSEAISLQCRKSTDTDIKRNSPEPDLNERQSPPKKTNNSSRSQVPSAKVSPQIIRKDMSTNVAKNASEFCEQSIESNLESRAEREIFLLSKRFNISIDSLKKTVVDEPLSVFHKKYSESVPPSMITISPIVKYVKTKLRSNLDCIGGNLDVEYKVEPMRESAAYDKSNLKDLVSELSKTMPSWSLSIVTNPLRYVISHMTIDVYGVPTANKCIVLDKNFRASVYINQCLEHTYCKCYTTATEIVNLIKELNSI